MASSGIPGSANATLPGGAAGAGVPTLPGAAALPHISLGLSLGAIEVGVLVGTLLFGCAAVQTYVYVAQFAHDRRWIQGVVAVVMLLETLHTVFVWMYLYHLTVDMFGNPFGLNSLPWYFDTSVALQAIVGAIVQAFFSYRVQVVSGKWWLAVPAYVGQVFRGAIGIAIACLTIQSGALNLFREEYSYMVYVTLITSVVTDVWNTTLLCFYLRNRKSAYKTTSNALQRIILWTIETGLVTTTCAILILVFWATMPGNGLWVSVLMIYAKLYSNSLLVSLNSRGGFRGTPSPSAATSSRGGQFSAPVMITRTYNVDVGTSPSGRGDLPADPEADSVPLDDLSGKGEYAFGAYK